jgi:hypothetical protein
MRIKQQRVAMMNKAYYETGIEAPEIVGSGSSFSNVVVTTNEREAFQAYHDGRNYLLRVTYNAGQRSIEWWDEEQKCWRV